MITNAKKTTRVSTTVVFETSLQNDTGVLFAVMSGKIDSTRPFGAVTMTVHNQAILGEYEEPARLAYKEFQEAVLQEASQIQTSIVTVEGGLDSPAIEEEP